MDDLFFIKKYNKLCKNLILSFYPFKQEDFVRYLSIIDFENDYIYKNPNIIWTDEIFKIVAKYFKFNKISNLKDFEITYNFIKQHEKYFDFSVLEFCKNISDVDLIVAEFGELLTWKNYLINKPNFNTIENIRRFKNKFDWEKLSKELKFPIDDEFITEFKDLIHVEYLGKNSNLVINIALLEKYTDKLNFNFLSSNPAAVDIIFNYPRSEKWNWNLVLQNRGLKITEDVLTIIFKYIFKSLQKNNPKNYPDDFLITLSKTITISTIIKNGIENAELLFEPQYKNFYHWNIMKDCNYNHTEKFFFENFENFDLTKSSGSWQKFISSQFILDNIHKFDLERPSFYRMNLSNDIIEKYSDQINHNGLSHCESIDWTWRFIDEHCDDLNFYKLAENPGVYRCLFKNTDHTLIRTFLDTELNLL